MTRREIVLNKLQALSSEEVSDAIKQLTHHISARLRLHSLFDRTKSGAHGEKNLGMNAIDYYVGESIKRLYDPKGWDWKFESYTLSEQLIRIANKLISDKVANFKKKQQNLPVIDEWDVSEIHNINQIAQENIEGNEEVYSKLIDLAFEVSKDDDNLYYFTCRYFESADYPLIATEMSLPINQVYVLRKKLIRRLSNYKPILTV